MRSCPVLVIFLLKAIVLFSQTPVMIADINPGIGSSFFAEEFASIEYNGKFIFTCNDGIHGVEPWIYDGRHVSLLKDINTGMESSFAQQYFLINNKVIFIAWDSEHGIEWWITDGTSEGTELLVDIYPGQGHGVFRTLPNVVDFYHTMYHGEVYFAGSDTLHNYELWKTDGTAEGTVLVKNIASDVPYNMSSYPYFYAEHDGLLFFSSQKGLWKTDGTTEGTVLVKGDYDFIPEHLFSFGNSLLMRWWGRLFVSDGTYDGTVEFHSLLPVSLGWEEKRFIQLEDFVLFPGSDGVHGDELWRTDGTEQGTYMVIDLYPGSNGYAPRNFVSYKGRVYYPANNGTSGIELWSTDGTENGTQLVKEFGSGIQSGLFFTTNCIFTDGNLLYLRAGPQNDNHLWISDGTTSGTYKVEINIQQSSYPRAFHKFGNKLFFFAQQGLGSEPHVIELLPTSSTQTKQFTLDIYPNPAMNFLYIRNDDIFDLSLYDMTGRIVCTARNTRELDVSALKNGSYLLQAVKIVSGEAYLNKVVLID